MGDHPQARKHFHAWLRTRDIRPADLGVKSIDEVIPIETPAVLTERMAENEPAARRIFYYTSRFRQEAGTERLSWHTESFHRHFNAGPVVSSLLADHPYFAGTGLGMGMKPDTAWGTHALALDWFDLARNRALDLIGIEDWMGLQYMYGPNYTWEGFQLMGFQASMIRSASRDSLPVIAWITPSDETNLRLKSASALCQGARHFFYWTYGPTCTSTENYWSDLRGAYDGVAAVTRQLADCGEIIARGKLPATRLAALYSISSDLWQPFDYLHMLERRCTYLSLVHDQYMVDFLTEEDIEKGRLADYDVLYATDPCVGESTVNMIRNWVKAGGWLSASCVAGSRNEFGEPVTGLADVLGIEPTPKTETQPGRYRVRGGLNAISGLDRIGELEMIGMRATLKATTGKVTEWFESGRPAVIESTFGNGRVRCVAGTPAISYAKAAKFVSRELKEKWPETYRSFINDWARQRQVQKPVNLSHPVVEAGLHRYKESRALVLANFQYAPIDALQVTVPQPNKPAQVFSSEHGKLAFQHANGQLTFTVPLRLSDIVRW